MTLTDDRPEPLAEVLGTHTEPPVQAPPTKMEKVLLLLQDAGRPLTTEDLATALKMTHPQVTNSMKRLRDRKAVARVGPNTWIAVNEVEVVASIGDRSHKGYTDRVRDAFREHGPMTTDEVVTNAGVTKEQAQTIFQRMRERGEVTRKGPKYHWTEVKLGTGGRKKDKRKNPEKGKFACPNCDKTFITAQGRGAHQRTHTHAKTVEAEQPQEEVVQVNGGDTFEVVGRVGQHVIARNTETHELVEIRAFDLRF
jgi:Mn-dependent DtxR family transcriptional regulator